MLELLPYLSFFAVFFIFAYFDIMNVSLSKASRQLIYLLALLLLILYAGCRWFDVPLFQNDTFIIFDYSAYEHVYKNFLPTDGRFFSEYLGADNYIRSMDFGYIYLSSFFSHYIFNSPNLFFLLISIVTIVLFAKGLNRNHITYGLFIILFVYLTRLYFQYNFIMMRQALAMSICWWAIPFIHQRRFKTFAFICILGGLMHFTGFLFIIVYFFPRFNFSNKFLFLTIPIALIISFTGLSDFIILKTLQSSLNSIGIGPKIVAYLENEIYSRGINPLNFLEITPFLYFAIKYKVSMYETKEGKFFFNMFIIYVFFMIITMNFMALTRISSYYIYSIFYIISVTFKNIKFYENRVLYGHAFCIYFFIYGTRFVFSNFHVYGYHLFFLN